MKTKSILVCGVILCCVFRLWGAPKEGESLTGRDIVNEYDRLAPINGALKEGKWTTNSVHYPQLLGTYNSRGLEEIFFCGDVCPQNGAVAISYVGVAESDCPALGDPVYLVAWGKQYKGCSPLVVKRGEIRKNDDSWILAYPGSTSHSTVLVPLVFDDQSICVKAGVTIQCQEFKNNLRVTIKGTKSGEALAVLSLDM